MDINDNYLELLTKYQNWDTLCREINSEDENDFFDNLEQTDPQCNMGDEFQAFTAVWWQSRHN